MSKIYDFVIVGAGFAGATCARLLTDKGYKCLIIEERPFVSGNCVSIKQNNIEIHCLGPHIIHTNDEEVWSFLNNHGQIRKFYPEIKSFNRGELYSFPPNIQTLYEIFRTSFPEEAKQALNDDIQKFKLISNIEEFCLSNYGKNIYNKLFYNYIKKLFNAEPKDLKIENLEYSKNISFIFDQKLYPEKYQGIPVNGYKDYIEGLIGNDIDVLLNTNFLKDKEKYIQLATNVIYTGELDKLFNYCIGPLEWVSVYFELEDMTDKTDNVFGLPIINFSCDTMKWYRSTEHKWLDPENNKDNEFTYVTNEYFDKWDRNKEAYYPILTAKSLNTYDRYLKKLNTLYPSFYICGRRPKYNFAHIADVIRDAIDLTDKFPDKNDI